MIMTAFNRICLPFYLFGFWLRSVFIIYSFKICKSLLATIAMLVSVVIFVGVCVILISLICFVIQSIVFFYFFWLCYVVLLLFLLSLISDQRCLN